MPEEILIKYLKDNLAAGFGEEEIKTALKKAGWQEVEIAEGFQSLKQEKTSAAILGTNFLTKHYKILLTILIILTAVPILVYLGYRASQKFGKTRPAEESQSSQETVQGAQIESAKEEALNRDLLRITDIQNLQLALDNYYRANKFYPPALSELVATKQLSNIPVEPRTNLSYLYLPFGKPASRYTLAFFLETKVGMLASGFQATTSEKPLPAETLQKQAELINGDNPAQGTADLKISDLASQEFSPQQEVTLEILNAEPLNITAARIQMQNLDLLDTEKPFAFRFSAPKDSGKYPLEVFAFDQKGGGHLAETILIISEQQEN